MWFQQKVTEGSYSLLLQQVWASRLVKTSPIFFQICLMFFSYTLSGILGRTIGAVSSHWLYTSFLAIGLVLIWRSRQKLINSKYSLIGILYACGAFAAHFAWNSPLRNLESDLPWASGLLISVNLFFFITLYQILSKLDEENK